MKYGLVLFKDTDNIGDDIQSYAASQFLPKIDYVIDREKLDEFIPEKREYVTTIMNGWYMHKKHHFPFSPYIHPLLISMHFSENDLITKPGYQFLDGYTKEFLSSYGKIGCRDESTKKALDTLGYQTYFSGCMTLTLDKVTKSKRGNYICVVDMKPEFVEKLKVLYPSVEIKEMTHWLIPEEQGKLTLIERMNRVKEYLAIYQNAKFVVTDRLHVALPCLALETPVLLVYYEHNADRLETFKDYVTYCSEDEYLAYTQEDFENIQNPTQYKKIRNSLKRRIKAFIEESKTIKLVRSLLPDKEDYIATLKRVNQVRNLCLEKITDSNKEIIELKDKVAKLEQENNVLRDQKNQFQPLAEEYEAIKNSRTFIPYKIYYHMKKKGK